MANACANKDMADTRTVFAVCAQAIPILSMDIALYALLDHPLINQHQNVSAKKDSLLIKMAIANRNARRMKYTIMLRKNAHARVVSVESIMSVRNAKEGILIQLLKYV